MADGCRWGSILALVIAGAACSELPRPLIFDGPPVWADGGAGADGGADLVPKADLALVDGASPPAAFDWRDGVMYFVLLDRFADGDSANNKAEGIETAADFQGGDLMGLLGRLKAGYFTKLGINVLWLSSPVDAPDGSHLGDDGHSYTGFHGYWPADLTRVEERLGSVTLLRQLVNEAHARGIRVVLDYVMNHVHQSSPTYTAHADWFWPLKYNGKDCICGNGCSWSAPEGLRCWFDPFLPDFDFSNSTARKFSVDNAIKWIQDTGVDGYRLDAIKHIDPSWLTDLRARIASDVVKGSGRRFYLVGETFDGDRKLLKQYVDPKTKLDGQFDFPLRAELVKVILSRKGSFNDLDTFLDGNAGYYGPGALMATFLGNHDLPRAIHLAEDTPQFGEWDTGKKRAWSNTPGPPSSSKPYERLAVAFAALMTLPGLPTIYYGDEVGMAGGGDPDNRRFMTFSGHSAAQDALRTRLSKLIALRRTYPALRRGARKQVWVDADLYVYTMTLGSEQLVVALNRSDTDRTISVQNIPSGLTDLLSGESVSAGAMVLDARSARVMK